MSNGRNMHTLSFPLGDALMLMETFRLAGNTAMMESKPDAERRLREYQAQFDALVPPAARQFSGKDFCEINIALSNATCFEVFIHSDRQSSWARPTTGRLVVQVGERQWVTRNYEIAVDGPEFNAVVQILEELAPMDCVRQDHCPEHPQGSC